MAKLKNQLPKDFHGVKNQVVQKISDHEEEIDLIASTVFYKLKSENLIPHSEREIIFFQTPWHKIVAVKFKDERISVGIEPKEEIIDSCGWGEVISDFPEEYNIIGDSAEITVEG